jgi:polygalacturonase
VSPSSYGRRRVLQVTALGAAAAALPRCLRSATRPPPLPIPPASTPWPEADAILARTELPRIPEATFAAARFGARGNGIADETRALQDAIDASAAAGGGRVVVEPGVFRVGALRLRSRVELYLKAGATLEFSDDPAKFPPVLTRYEGFECVNRSPMLHASGETDVAVTGEGTLDASRTAAWNRGSDREGVLEPLVARGIPPERRVAVGKLRTSMVEMTGCTRVRIQGVTLQGSPFWQLHPTLCADVTVEEVTTRDSGANSDSCDPESCDRVVLRGCTFASGDDNIALKSGRDVDGRRIGAPCRNVVIVGCQGEGRFGFITCGSEQSGGIENVYAFANRSYGRGVGYAVWVKSNRRRGGYTRNLNVSGFRGHTSRAAILATMEYDGQSGAFPPVFDGIHLDDFVVDGADGVLDVKGLPESRIRGFTLSDSTFTAVRAEDVIRDAEVAVHNLRVERSTAAGSMR